MLSFFFSFRSFRVLLASACLASLAARGQVTLIDGEQAHAVVVLPAEAEAEEEKAAKELVEHLERMTGVRLPRATLPDVPTESIPIYLGQAGAEELDAASRAAGDNVSSFTLRVAEGRIDIRGLGAEGTLFGVYELLEQIGFRWYIPGDLGTVVPEGNRVRVKLQSTTQAPSMDYRVLQSMAPLPWYQRQRLGGNPRSTGAHGLPGLPAAGSAGRALFEQHPELFSLIDGERKPRQHCLSNPETLRRVVDALRNILKDNPDRKYIGMGPRDGRGFCECDGCRALDGGVIDPFYGQESMTDRYVEFFNRVLENLEADYPDLHLVWYVYGLHMMPPASVKPNPRIVGVFAPISMDRIRGMTNPMSPDRHTFRWLIDAWTALKPNEMYYRGYYNNLACPQFPKTQLDRVRNEIPYLHRQGLNVMRVEVIRQSWASDPLTLYVASRLMWNVDTDVDALLAEFYARFYGPAREPMQAYHEALEAAFADTPYCTGSSYLYLPIFDAARRDRLRGMLDQAALRAPREGEGLYGERVWALRQGFDRLELFLDMMNARNAHDFNTAHDKMRQYYALTEALTQYELEVDPEQASWIRLGRDSRLVNRREHPGTRGNYFDRFFSGPVKAGYERTVSKGDRVAALPDEWLFLLDPAEIGEIGGWHRPGALGGNWQPIKTSSRSWSDQGLHYYKGVAWYRQKVRIPPEFKGRPVYLWFGGVDRLASVWVNERFLGSSREPGEGLPGVPGSFRPFDLRATDAVRFDADNWVVVRIENKSLSELGTGGILAPVMFWSPRDPAWQPGE